jgi:hypothetical protein
MALRSLHRRVRRLGTVIAIGTAIATPIAIGGVLSVGLGIATGVVHADSWVPARITETFSDDRAWFVRVTPGGSLGDTVGFAGAAKGARARAEWFARQPDGSYRIVARATLVNPIAPVHTLVTDRGYLVAIDNWHNVGYGAAVASYKPDGSRVVTLTLADLYSRAEIEAFSHTVSSIWWRDDAIYVRAGHRSIYVGGRTPGHELILEPETGRWQVCQPRPAGHQCRTQNEPRTWGSFVEPGR